MTKNEFYSTPGGGGAGPTAAGGGGGVGQPAGSIMITGTYSIAWTPSGMVLTMPMISWSEANGGGAGVPHKIICGGVEFVPAPQDDAHD